MVKHEDIKERIKLLDLIHRRKFSIPIREITVEIFDSIESNSEKEQMAKLIYPLVEQSKTEKEAVEKIKELMAAL